MARKKLRGRRKPRNRRPNISTSPPAPKVGDYIEIIIKPYINNIKVKGIVKKSNTKKPAPKINSKSRLLLPPRALEAQMAGRIGFMGSPQSKIAIEYGLRDDITIGISNSNYLNTFDFSARTNYLNKLIDKFDYPINIVYNSIISTQMDKPQTTKL